LGRKHAAGKRQRGVALGCDFDEFIGLKQCRHCFMLALVAELLMRIIKRYMDVGPKLADYGSALARLIDAE
jgi:hypothetical protein